jgi:hypothetical protein
LAIGENRKSLGDLGIFASSGKIGNFLRFIGKMSEFCNLQLLACLVTHTVFTLFLFTTPGWKGFCHDSMQQGKSRGTVMGNRIMGNEPEHIVLNRVGHYVVAHHTADHRSHSPAVTHWTLIGLLLMIAGFALLAYQGIRYTLEMQSGGAGRALASRQINLPLSPLIGISAMFAGYVLIVRDKN